MDNKTFKQNALRTESMDMERITARLEYPPVACALISQLSILASNLRDLDEIKKYLFYGKESHFLTGFEKTKYPLLSNVLPMTVGTMIEQSENLCQKDVTRLLHGVIGIATEAGELIEALFKVMNGRPADAVNFMEEISDVNWYEAIIADTLNFEIDDANARVIEKLKKRFPEKFTEAHAINRDLQAERATLEGTN